MTSHLCKERETTFGTPIQKLQCRQTLTKALLEAFDIDSIKGAFTCQKGVNSNSTVLQTYASNIKVRSN